MFLKLYGIQIEKGIDDGPVLELKVQDEIKLLSLANEEIDQRVSNLSHRQNCQREVRCSKK